MQRYASALRGIIIRDETLQIRDPRTPPDERWQNAFRGTLHNLFGNQPDSVVGEPGLFCLPSGRS